MLVLLSSGVRRRIDHHRFPTFFVGFAFGSARAYWTCGRPAEGDWSSVDGVHGWFPLSFADGRVQDLVEVFPPSLKREASGNLGVNRLYVGRGVVQAGPLQNGAA